ncbi:MAG: hypothetical protein IKG11_09040 [Atopobiaceae bacterium]|nr:hypothetical protein [Atopobiaceae bacterium]
MFSVHAPIHLVRPKAYFDAQGMGGEHATSVLGNGRPGMEDVLALAREVGLPARRARLVAIDIQAACHDLLRKHCLV